MSTLPPQDPQATAEAALAEPEALADLVAQQALRPLPGFMTPLLAEVRRRFPTSVHAVFFYGSCRRTQRAEGVVDLYVVLDNTGDLKGFNRLLSVVLPPSVYFLTVRSPIDGAEIRCKCSTVMLPAFRKGTSRRWFLPYLWARFSQPVTLAYARDPAARTEMLACLERAGRTFIGRAVPLMPTLFTAREFWLHAFTASYRTELRSESAAKIAELYTLEHDHLDRLLAATAAEGGLALTVAQVGAIRTAYRHSATAAARRNARWLWRGRIVVGKLLSFGRITKSWYTFDGGLDYVVWKLQRHSGQQITIPDAVRKRPWLRVWGFLWQLYRRGVFR